MTELRLKGTWDDDTDTFFTGFVKALGREVWVAGTPLEEMVDLRGWAEGKIQVVFVHDPKAAEMAEKYWAQLKHEDEIDGRHLS